MIIGNRIKNTTTTAGTGDLTLGAAAAGYYSIADYATAETPYHYLLEWEGGYEIGQGLFVPPSTLQRTWIYQSSTLGSVKNTFGAGSQTNLPAGSKTVSLTVPDFSYLAVHLDEQAMQNYTYPEAPVALGNGAMAAGIKAQALVKSAVALGTQSTAQHLKAIQIGRGKSFAPSSMMFAGGWSGETAFDMTMLGPLSGEQVFNINCSDNGFFFTIGSGAPYGKMYAEMTIFANGDADTYIGHLKYAILDGVLTVIQALTTEMTTLGTNPTATVVLSEDMDDFGNNLVKVTYTCPAAANRWAVRTRVLARQ